VLDLADVNAGPSSLIAFWNLSKSPPMSGVASLIAAAHSGADICRHAGAGAATAAIHAHPVAQRMLGGEALPAGGAAWISWHGKRPKRLRLPPPGWDRSWRRAASRASEILSAQD
jgi:hypothetical protein